MDASCVSQIMHTSEFPFWLTSVVQGKSHDCPSGSELSRKNEHVFYTNQQNPGDITTIKRKTKREQICGDILY